MRERSPNKKGFNNNEEKKIENELKIKKGEISVLHFDKTKGKGLDCIHESNEARSICDHHLNIIKPHKKSSGSGCLGVTDHSIKKPVTRALKGQTRSINKGRYPSSNANQFYYYSGFGPWQAKRRSERGESDGKETANDHSIPITVNGTAQSTTPPSPVPIIYIDDDSEEEDSD
ncbi:unnamed protein product [Dovyalis caffra]|uniref:Uncharacterized protein n=1 Tax=Dovyalis caffra TaxID=77055 RepID=A0AAV1SE89_9ROSI|nr:unnamed protein product [Dovyalis caffra]